MVQNSVDFKQNVYMKSYYQSYQDVFTLYIYQQKCEIMGYEKRSKFYTYPKCKSFLKDKVVEYLLNDHLRIKIQSWI